MIAEKKDVIEERAKVKFLLFLKDGADIHSLKDKFIKIHKKGMLIF